MYKLLFRDEDAKLVIIYSTLQHKVHMMLRPFNYFILLSSSFHLYLFFNIMRLKRSIECRFVINANWILVFFLCFIIESTSLKTFINRVISRGLIFVLSMCSTQTHLYLCNTKRGEIKSKLITSILNKFKL